MLLHPGGAGVDSRALPPTFDALSQVFHAYTPEQRAHGRTPDADGPISYELMAQDTILAGVPVLAVTLALTAVALLVGGMIVGRLTGQPILRSGIRQLVLGGLAIAVTFGVGRLIGGHGT